MKVAAPALLAVLSLGLARPAHADLPPPPGYARVQYGFQLAAPVEGRVIVAYPTYVSAGGVAEVVEAGKDYQMFQGYAPGLYSMAAADAAALPKDFEAVKKLLAERAVTCIKAMPRVYQVPVKDGFTRMRDVFRVTVGEAKCKTELVSTTYEGNGNKVEGGVFANGTRNIPAPFAAFEVPPIGDIGLDLSGAAQGGPPPQQATPPANDPAGGPAANSDTPPTSNDPPRGGCAGCTHAGHGSELGAWSLLGLVPIGAAAQRRRARRRRPQR